MLIMSHGYHNALASKINNYQSCLEELQELKNKGRVKWASHVPELVTHSKEYGRILIMSHGYHNALASKINNYQSSPEELQKLKNEGRVKWTSHVPELVTHSKESIEKLFLDAGFYIHKTYGLPVFVQPGPEDFDPGNEKKSSVSKYLENPDIFKLVFEIEMKYNSCETVVNRGMNIFMLVEKK